MGQFGGGRKFRAGAAALAVALVLGVGAPLAITGLGLSSAFGSGTPGTCKSGYNTTELCSTTKAVAGAITGKVVGSGGAALDGICVHIYPGGGNLTNTNDAVTDTTGNWTIAGLPAGSYDVRFSTGCSNTSNLVPVWYGGGGPGAPTEAGSTPVTVTVGQYTSGVDVVMSVAGGVITGKVTNSSSVAVAGVCVSAFPAGGTPYVPTGTATTGSNGTYSLSGLRSGSYDVRFDPSCSNTVATPYATGYYATSGVTATASGATAVAVTAGVTTHTIGGKLADGPQASYGTASISGTVSGLVSTDASPVCVDAFIAGTTDQIGFQQVSPTTTDTYTFTNLGKGTYDVEFDPSCGNPGGPGTVPKYSAQWYDSASSAGAATEAASTPVTVSSSTATVTGIDTTLATATGTVSGTVSHTVSGTVSPAGGACVNLYVAGSSSVFASTSTPTSTPSPGTYSLAVPDGSYNIEFTKTCGDSNNDAYQWYTATPGGSASQSAAATVAVTTGSTFTATATLAAGGSISGSVTAPPLAAHAFAEIYPVGGSTPVASGFGGGTSSPFAYTASGLPTGTYDVQFLASTASGSTAREWYAGSSASLDRAGASAVSVTAGATTPTINATFGDISGTVTDPAGDAVSAQVTLSAPGSTTFHQFATTPTPTGTPPVASYNFGVVPEGSFDVGFTTATTPPGNLASQWYNDKATLASATPVPVTSATPVSTIDATMQVASTTTTGGAISGDVYGAGGSQAFGICVDVYTTSLTAIQATGQSYPGGTSGYSVSGLPTGSYKVKFDPTCGGRDAPGYPVQYYDSGATNLTTTHSATATNVSVTTGSTTPGINDQLPTNLSVSDSATAVTATPTAGDASPPVYGQPITYAATVTAGSGATPTGTVTFTVTSGGTLLTLCTTSTLSAGSAHCTATDTPVGTGETVTGAYTGPSFIGSTGTTTVTVAKSPTTVSLQASLTNPAIGQTVTYTATVSPPLSGGSVTFATGGSAVTCTGGTQNVSAGKATCSLSYPSTGSHSVTATYGGDADYAASVASSAAPVTVVGAASTTSVTATPTAGDASPPVYGQPITYAATVLGSGSGAAPTGTVKFTATSGGTLLTLCTTSTLSSGSASCTATGTPAGTGIVTGTYGGNATYGSSSGTTSVTVAKASTTTSLSVTPASPVVGQTVTYMATVAVTAPGAGTPTGTVAFKTGTSTIVCTGGNQSLSSGTATCTLAYPSTAGSHSVTAAYAGDTNFTGSVSSPAKTVTVAKASTTTSLSVAPASPVVGQTVTYTATVAVTAPGAGAPTGTVAFTTGTTPITCTGGTQSLSSGHATCSLTYTSSGTHSVTAAYAGDTNFTGSVSSPAKTVTVAKASTTTSLSVAPASPVVGQTVTYTATVAVTAPGAGAPTGTVAFTTGTTPIVCTGGTQSLSSGHATCSLTYTSSGTHSVTAAYAGDTNFSGSTSSPAKTVTVAKASTTTTVSPVPSSVDYGTPVTYDVSVLPQVTGVPTGTVSVSLGGTHACTVTLALGSGSCTANATPAGKDQVSAVYAGDANFDGSTGNAPVTVTVPPPPPPAGSTSSNEATNVNATGSASATSGNVSAKGTGVGSVTVANYTGNPTTGSVTGGTGAFYDVATGIGSDFTSLTITICHPVLGQSLEWWNGTAWAQFTKQATAGGCLVATVTATTSPTLAQLTGTPIAVSTALPSSAAGYYEVASDGGIFAFTAPFDGSMGGHALNAPIVGMAELASGNGYYEVASDGGIFAFTAPFHGSMGGHALNKPIVGMAVLPTGKGYYEVASDGGIFAFTAPFHGSMGGHALNKPIVGMAVLPTGKGYYEVASDGGIFAFTAPFHGSMGGHALNAAIVGMAELASGNGYYEVASDGGIFAFTAPFHGSMGGHALNAPIVGMAELASGNGYYEVASDGGIFAFTAPFHGSMGGKHLNKPIVGIAAG